jgi:hypothetical protein
MDGKPPAYEGLLDPTRIQPRRIEEFRAAVKQLNADLEPSGRTGKRQAASVEVPREEDSR